MKITNQKEGGKQAALRQLDKINLHKNVLDTSYFLCKTKFIDFFPVSLISALLTSIFAVFLFIAWHSGNVLAAIIWGIFLFALFSIRYVLFALITDGIIHNQTLSYKYLLVKFSMLVPSLAKLGLCVYLMLILAVLVIISLFNARQNLTNFINGFFMSENFYFVNHWETDLFVFCLTLIITVLIVNLLSVIYIHLINYIVFQSKNINQILHELKNLIVEKQIKSLQKSISIISVFLCYFGMYFFVFAIVKVRSNIDDPSELWNVSGLLLDPMMIVGFIAVFLLYIYLTPFSTIYHKLFYDCHLVDNTKNKLNCEPATLGFPVEKKINPVLSRINAAIIDQIIINFIVFAIDTLIFKIISNRDLLHEIINNTIWLMSGMNIKISFFVITLFVSCITTISYYIFFEARFNGSSPGKRLMNLHIIKKDGSLYNHRTAVLRNITRILDNSPIGLTLILFSPSHKSLGDRIANAQIE